MSEAGWPDGADDFVQAIADTKLVLSHRYAQWMLAGETLEDDIGGAASAQEEIGHVRQLFRALQNQGRTADWLERERSPTEIANAAALDANQDSWHAFIATAGPIDRAAWYLLDAIDHPDLNGLIRKIGEDEYFHLQFHDARLETLAADRPEEIQASVETALPSTLAFIGPASHDDEYDPLYSAGFTDRPVDEIRTAFRAHYEELFGDTAVSLEAVDWSAPDPERWDSERRRVGGGGIEERDLGQLRGEKNRQFAID